MNFMLIDEFYDEFFIKNSKQINIAIFLILAFLIDVLCGIFQLNQDLGLFYYYL
jgi:hypothetical protein